jgi:hypothetical protein
LGEAARRQQVGNTLDCDVRGVHVALSYLKMTEKSESTQGYEALYEDAYTAFPQVNYNDTGD